MALSRDEIVARSKRLYPDWPVNPYTGTLNDPFQEAQSRYADVGGGWSQFFGGLQKQQEDAQLAGKSFKVGWGGFGNEAAERSADARGAALVPRGRGAAAYTGTLNPLELNPLEAQTAKETAINQGASDEVDRAKAEMLAQDEAAKRVQQGDINDLYSAYQQHVLNSVLGPPTSQSAPGALPEGTSVSTGPGGRPTFTMRGTVPANPVDRLSQLPGSMQAGTILPAAQEKLQERAQALRERTEAASEASNPLMMFQVPRDATGKPLSGPALMQGLSPAVRNQVQSLLDGRSAAPQGTAMKDPYWKSIITLANQVDPNFDTVNFNARAKTRTDFTSGKAAGQINAINTVIGHLTDLAHTGEQLGNFGMDWANKVYNALTPGGSTRGVAINNFETLKEGVGNELMRVWRQVGAGSEKEIEDWKATIGASKSPQELRGAFKTIGGMLESKLSALDEQYKQGMGTDKVSAIAPTARANLDRLQGAAPAKASVPPAPAGFVEMVAPDGRPLHVPAGEVDRLTEAGAKRAGGR